MIDLGLADGADGVNPFHFGSTSVEEFVARWPLIKEMAGQLAYGPNSYACSGGRRFGKSSILKVLDYVLQHEQSLQGRILTLRVAPLLQRYGTPEEVFRCFYRLLHREAGEVVERLCPQRLGGDDAREGGGRTMRRCSRLLSPAVRCRRMRLWLRSLGMASTGWLMGWGR